MVRKWGAPQFEEKMHDVLVVYKQVEMLFDKDGNLLPYEGQFTHTIYTMKSQTFKPLGELKI